MASHKAAQGVRENDPQIISLRRRLKIITKIRYWNRKSIKDIKTLRTIGYCSVISKTVMQPRNRQFLKFPIKAIDSSGTESLAILNSPGRLWNEGIKRLPNRRVRQKRKQIKKELSSGKRSPR
jgi:hypothetical protein